jgi:glycosyltransferase involved in cell wall biosynthesis
MADHDVTLIVPVRDEARTIDAFVESLLAQSLRPVEIVIADGGSRDDTKARIGKFIAAGAPIRLVEDANALPGRGRNLAIRAARTEWIAMTDAGTLVDDVWLERLVDALPDRENVDAVFGTYEPVIRGRFAECLALAFVPPASKIAGENVRGPSTASMLIRKSAWEALGGFPEDLRACEDLLFFARFDARGLSAAAAPRAVVRWNIPTSVGAVFRRFRVYSTHTIKAGLWRSWHFAVARMYAVGAVFAALGLFVHWAFAVAIPLGLLFRAHRSIRLRGPWLRLSRRVGVLAYLGVAAFILVIDVAMFAGALDFAASRVRSRLSARARSAPR